MTLSRAPHPARFPTTFRVPRCRLTSKVASAPIRCWFPDSVGTRTTVVLADRSSAVSVRRVPPARPEGWPARPAPARPGAGAGAAWSAVTPPPVSTEVATARRRDEVSVALRSLSP
ncbi:hypothetical protein NKH18_50425 [Streptomyces sp. M10(2022)]